MTATATKSGKVRHIVCSGVICAKPTRRDCEDLQVGDLALNCFGQWRRVTSIYAKGNNVRDGGAYVCFYTEYGPGSSMSGSYAQDEYVATVPATSRWHRTECFPAID